MKIIIFSVIITMLLPYGQGQTTDDTIKSIDKKCESIKLDISFEKVTLVNEDFLDTAFLKQKGGGYGLLIGYFKSDTICRIYEQYGIRSLNDIAETDYYFDKGRLIFVYEKENYIPEISIDSTGTVDHKIPGPDFEGYYYFDKEKIIFTNTKGKQQILPNEMFFDSQSKEGQLLLSAQTYFDLLKKKKNK